VIVSLGLISQALPDRGIDVSLMDKLLDTELAQMFVQIVQLMHKTQEMYVLSPCSHSLAPLTHSWLVKIKAVG